MTDTVSSNALKTWLEGKKRRGVLAKVLSAGLSLLAGIVVLVITFAITWFVVFLAVEGFSSVYELISGTKLQIGRAACLMLSAVFIVLLFVQTLKTDPEYWGQYPQKELELDPRLRSNAGDLGPFVDILLRPRASANVIASVLLSGPRLVMGTLARLTEASRLKHMDTAACAEVLALIHSRNEAVPYEELRVKGWIKCVEQLRCIEDVYFLASGLCLSEELRAELNELN